MPKTYTCCCCGYETIQKPHMYRHLYNKKKLCPLRKDGIPLTDDIKEYILQNTEYHSPTTNINSSRVWPAKATNNLVKNKNNKTSNKSTNEKETKLEEKIKKLTFALQSLSTKKNEEFYQKIVEEFLNGKHKYLEDGSITDVTNETIHAEIKNWDCYKEALGQLLWYNSVDPKSELHLYLFGTISAKKYESVKKRMMDHFNIKIYTFQITNDVVSIIDSDGEVVHDHSVNVTDILKTEEEPISNVNN